MKRGDFSSRIDPKPPLNQETNCKRKPRERKLGSACWRGGKI